MKFDEFDSVFDYYDWAKANPDQVVKCCKTCDKKYFNSTVKLHNGRVARVVGEVECWFNGPRKETEVCNKWELINPLDGCY